MYIYECIFIHTCYIYHIILSIQQVFWLSDVLFAIFLFIIIIWREIIEPGSWCWSQGGFTIGEGTSLYTWPIMNRNRRCTSNII